MKAGIQRNAIVVRIPTKKIIHSELMKIITSPSDAGKSIVRRMIVMGQEKGCAHQQPYFVSSSVSRTAGANFA